MSIAYYNYSKKTGTIDPLEFLSYLSSRYLDLNLSQKALIRLGLIIQKDKEPFISFLPKFKKELANIDRAGQTAIVKISYLKKALNREIQRELKGQLNIPTKYYLYIRALQDLGANLNKFYSFSQQHTPQRLAQKGKQEHTKTLPPCNLSPCSLLPNTIDQEPIKISKAVQRQDKELAGKRAKQANKKEIALRRKEKRYLQCRRDSYQIIECPLLPLQRPNS